ncbi:MAG: c-type cytochrome [Hyphomicrobiaceae bacterium]|jgi:mono/diheme cytochrome c family protein
MSADVAEGRQLAETLCATCHLRGNETDKTAPASIPGFRAIARRPGQSADGIVTWLLSMPPMMPNHHLTRDEMDKVAAYILSLAEP